MKSSLESNNQHTCFFSYQHILKKKTLLSYELGWRWKLYGNCSFCRHIILFKSYFVIWNHFYAQIIDIIFRSKIWRKFPLDNISSKNYKVVHINEICNFVVQTASIWVHFSAQMIDTMFRFKIQILDLDSMWIIWVWRWLQMKKVWTAKL
jgi:hypothetical protein